MKKALLFLLLLTSKGLYAQKPGYTDACNEKCVLGYHDIIEICYYEDFEGCEPMKNTVFGLFRYGEIIGMKTSDERGEFVIPLPDFQESDYYSLHLFLPYERRICMMGSSKDTLIFQNRPESFKKKIYCIEHKENAEVQPKELITLQKEVKVFPNPARDFSTLLFDEAFSGTIRVINTTGISLFQISVESQQEISIPLQNISGLHYLQAFNRQGLQVFYTKIIVVP
ncbi:MAG: T9SS type A sorting domain-containing protein [Flavobacteriales bacterium]|nr:T9SS type A sorting domain-containing protein [Flavobacteriales bacterium]